MSRLAELSRKDREKIHLPLCYTFRLKDGKYAKGMVDPKEVHEKLQGVRGPSIIMPNDYRLPIHM